MPTSEEITAQQELLVVHRRTLEHLLVQQAQMGSLFAPPHVLHGIQEARANIRRIKNVLRTWGEVVEEQPDDESPDEARRVRVFISYKRDVDPDEQVALQVYQTLRRQHDVFIDQLMSVGVRWAEQIEAEMRRTDFLIIFLSAASIHSEMVLKEIEMADHLAKLQSGRPTILPVRLGYREPFPYPLSAYLDHINWAFWTGPEDTPRLIEELVQAISNGELNQPGEALVSNEPQRALPLPMSSALLTDPNSEMQLRELLSTYKIRLRELEKQKAIHGIYPPVHLTVEIEDVRQRIRELDSQLGQKSSFKFSELTNWNRNWQIAADFQRKARKPYQIVSELMGFISDLCNLLDFVVIQNHFHVHHNQFISCRIKAPTLHLNLPTEFPLIFIIEEKLSDDSVKQLSHIPNMMGVSADFGLIFTSGSHVYIQQTINRLIRPAMRNDLIVLGSGFLEDITISTSPQTVLLNAILREVELTRISPFMAGGTDLTDRMFFGREGELRNIAESITKTSVAITCGRRIGKTSLLNRLARVVLPARDHNCYFLNCQPVHDYRELRTEMMTIWKRPDLPFDPDQPNSFAQIVTALSNPEGAPPIFLLDEVDELLKYDTQNQQRLFKQLRALSLDGRARFIMTGERSVQTHIHNADSPLFNFFGLNVRLSFLDYASVNKLVIEPLSEMQIELRDPLPMIDSIFSATSGHPYLVQRFCQGLVQAISRQGVRIIGPEYIEAVLDDSAYQQDYFETVWGQAPLLARIITMLIEKEGAKLPEIQKRLKEHNINSQLREINAALDVLALYSVVTRKGGQYRFVATAFPEMMQRAYGDDIETNIELRCEEYLWEQQSSNILAH